MNSGVRAFSFCLALVLTAGVHLVGQDFPIDSEVVHPYQRVTISHLAAFAAHDTSRSAVAKAAVGIALSAWNLRCDSDSQIETAADAKTEGSLRALVTNIAGTSCKVNGRRFRVGANFVPNAAIQANNIIAFLREKRPLLLEWKRRLYVLFGVVYDEHLHYSGRQDNVIRELLLIDPRYSDKRRLVAFRRGKDDFSDVEGLHSSALQEIRRVLPFPSSISA